MAVSVWTEQLSHLQRLTSQRKTQSESITNHFPLYSELALSLPTNSTESLSQRWIVKVVDSCRFSLDRRTIFDRLKKTGLECHIMPVVCGSVCVLDRDNWTSIQRGCCCWQTTVTTQGTWSIPPMRFLGAIARRCMESGMILEWWRCVTAMSSTGSGTGGVLLNATQSTLRRVLCNIGAQFKLRKGRYPSFVKLNLVSWSKESPRICRTQCREIGSYRLRCILVEQSPSWRVPRS